MRRGFTIIEVLVALAVFAYAAIVMSASYIGVLNAYGRAHVVMQTDEDVKFARAELLNQSDYTTAQAGDTFDTVDGRNVSWVATINDQGTIPDLFAVNFQCTVTPADTSVQPVTTTESFIVLRPTWSDPATRSSLQQADRQNIRNLNAAQTQ